MREIVRRYARMAAAAVFTVLLSSLIVGFQAAPGQVLYYKFEETGGNTALDSSGNGFDGIWTTSSGTMAMSAIADCAPNVPGNTRSLILTKPGAVTQAGAHISTTSNPAFTFTGPFTAMAWIKPTAFNSGDNPNNTGAIIQKWDWQDPPQTINGYGMNRDLSGTISFWMGDNVQSNILTTSATTAVGAWSHVCIIFTGTGRQIYINGALSTSDTWTRLGASPAALHIGLDDWARNYYGNVDEVRLFNTALTAAEVMTYYQGAQPPGGLVATNGIDSVTLTWNPVTGATGYNVLRSATTGGPYVQIGTTPAATTTYTDNTALNPNTYFYVVQTVLGTITSSNSIEVRGDPLPPAVTARPNTGLQTNENGSTTNFDVKFNNPAPAGNSVVTVQSNDTTEGTVSTTYPGATPFGNGFQVTVLSGQTPTIPVTVRGVSDFLLDGNIAYTISVTATNMGAVIPDVNVTNNDNNTAGVTFSRTSGLVTTESGGTDVFTVSLNTQPYGTITMSLTSSLTSEGTVSPASILFTNANWNAPQQVTLTGVDDSVIDFTIPYTIVTGNLMATNINDAAYNGLKPPNVSAVNIDNEVVPKAPGAWGNCGLIGLETGLVFGLAALRRRRRRA